MPNAPKQFRPSKPRRAYKPKEKRPSAWRRGYDARWQRLRKLVLERDHYLCQACKAKGKITTHKGMNVDHIKPMSQGGAQYDMSNLQTLCHSCHSTKTASEDGGFGHGH